jgi:SdrD B-like domain/Right handed beta helix region
MRTSPISRRLISAHNRARLMAAIEPLESRQLLSSVVVNTTADSIDASGSSTVSLRDAVAMANAAKSATTITFSSTVFNTAKTIILAKGTLSFSNTAEATTITGPAAGVTISGNNAVQGIYVSSQVALTLLNLTISKCMTGLGAGIETAGNLTVQNCTLSNNDATASDDGGGIAIDGGTTKLINDTIANNIGDGLNPRGGTVTIADCTITNNSSYGGFTGAGIYVQGGSVVTVSNSIIAGNKQAATSGSEDVFGPFVSKGHNLIGEIDSSTGWISSDLTGTVAKPLNPKLGALASNGGPTQTVLPLAGSPALGAGSTSLIPSGVTTDQRGLPRIVSSKVDIGSVEIQPVAAIKITAPAAQSTSVGISTKVSLGSFTQIGSTSPFKDAITWGDGSASTVLTLSAAGTIPATAHTFAKTGTFTVTEIIADAKGNKSNTITFKETVTAPPSSISGTVFDDANGDGKIDNGEYGSGLWTVDLDLVVNGKTTTNYKTTTTDINGKFSFTGLAAGSYVVRVIPVTGTTPTEKWANKLAITLAAGVNSTGNLFGEKATG